MMRRLCMIIMQKKLLRVRPLAQEENNEENALYKVRRDQYNPKVGLEPMGLTVGIVTPLSWM